MYRVGAGKSFQDRAWHRRSAPHNEPMKCGWYLSIRSINSMWTGIYTPSELSILVVCRANNPRKISAAFLSSVFMVLICFSFSTGGGGFDLLLCSWAVYTLPNNLPNKLPKRKGQTLSSGIEYRPLENVCPLSYSYIVSLPKQRMPVHRWHGFICFSLQFATVALYTSINTIPADASPLLKKEQRALFICLLFYG